MPSPQALFLLGNVRVELFTLPKPIRIKKKMAIAMILPASVNDILFLNFLYSTVHFWGFFAFWFSHVKAQ